MKIVESLEYDIDVNMQELPTDKIIVVRYPLYVINREVLVKIHESIKRRFDGAVLFIPDVISIETMSKKDLNKIMDTIKGIIDEREHK